MYKKQLKSLDELYLMGYRIEPKEPPIRSYVKEYMKQKGFTVTELAERTGISRQSMHNILRGDFTPGVDLALKLSEVLETPVEKLFKLTSAAWVSTVKLKGDRSLYFDIFNSTILDKEAMEKEIEEDPRVFYDMEQKRFITEEEKKQLEQQEIEETLNSPERIEALIPNVRDVDKRSVQRLVRETLEEKHRIRFVPKYQKLVRTVKR